MCAPCRNQGSLRKRSLRGNYCRYRQTEKDRKDSVGDLVLLDQLGGRVVVRRLEGILIVVVVVFVAIVIEVTVTDG